MNVAAKGSEFVNLKQYICIRQEDPKERSGVDERAQGKGEI